MFPLPAVGRFLIPTSGGYNATVLPGDSFRVTPLPRLSRLIGIDQVAMRVSTVGVGSNLNGRIAIFRDRDGVPGELVFDSGVISVASLGGVVVNLDTEIVIGDDALWLGANFQGGNTTNATLATLNGSAVQPQNFMLGVASAATIPTTAAEGATGLLATWPFASGVPTDGSVIPWGLAAPGSIPIVALRRAF